MLVPILVGLPGAGKSTLAAAVADCLGVGVFRSDPLFRVCRALPAGCGDPRRAIHDAYLARVARDHPARLDAVAADSGAVDDAGRCALHDGKRFRVAHGEDAFRTFEVEMLSWAVAAGVVGVDVPDLSASAPLLPEVRAMFSAAAGYVPVLLDVPRRVVAARTVADYEAFAAGREAGAAATLRGGYEDRFDAAAAGAVGEAERGAALYSAALAMADEAAAKRMERYSEWARLTFAPPPGATPRQAAAALLEAVARAQAT